jgi:acyl carrier protein
MADLFEEIKVLIIESLDLEEITPADIDAEGALFGDGLGLDSIDSLELGLVIQKRYGIKIDANSKDIQKWFFSVSSLCEFIKEMKTT